MQGCSRAHAHGLLPILLTKYLYWILRQTTFVFVKWHPSAYFDQLRTTRHTAIASYRQITLRIVGYHFSSRLKAILNLCLIYFKITWALAILIEHMQNKFEINRTKIKGGCQSGRKVVTHNSKSDLPLVSRTFYPAALSCEESRPG